MKILIPIAFFIFLSACAGNRVSKEEAQSLLRMQSIPIVIADRPLPLSVHTKTHAVGDLAVSTVVATMAPAAVPEIQAAQPLSSAVTGTIESASEVEKNQQQEERIDMVVAHRLRQNFPESASAKDNTDLLLQVKPRKWQLEYVAIVGSSDYALAYEIEVNLLRNKAGKQVVARSWDCSGESSKHMVYDAWKGNDYEAVRFAIPAIAEDCVQQLHRQGLM